jgi:hypothetical protein
MHGCVSAVGGALASSGCSSPLCTAVGAIFREVIDLAAVLNFAPPFRWLAHGRARPLGGRVAAIS